LKLFGENLQTARKRRGETLEQFAKRIGITRQTLAEMERGAAGVAIGSYAMALWVIGMTDDLAQAGHPDRDIQGKVAEREGMPQRVRERSSDRGRYEF
jgi:transcriptional regulator with XRE-family HTH domain